MKAWMKVTVPAALAVLAAAVVFLAISLISTKSQLSDVSAQYAALKDENESISGQLLSADDQLQSAQTHGPKVVAIVNGEEIMSDEPMAQYEEQAAECEQNGQADPDTLEQLKASIVNQFVQDKVSNAKAHALGLDQLTEQEKTDIQTQADQTYEEEIASQVEFTQVEGQSDEDARKAAIQQLETNGYTKDALVQQMTANRISDKLFDYATQSTTLSEDELKQYYDERLESDKQAYSNKPSDYELADADGATVTYIPEGVRYVKHIYLSYTDDQLASLDQLRSDLTDAQTALASNADQPEVASKKAELEKEISGIRDVLAARIADVQGKLAAGESFDSLIAQYGEDVALQDEPVKTRGVALTASSEVRDPAYTQAAMALTPIGATSEPVYTDYGVYLIEYVGDATPGPVALASIHDALHDEALSVKKQDAYVAAVDQWVSEAGVQYFYENMN